MFMAAMFLNYAQCVLSGPLPLAPCPKPIIHPDPCHTHPLSVGTITSGHQSFLFSEE